jgi:hypothetical protein
MGRFTITDGKVSFETERKVRVKCGTCGSEDVRCNADAAWNVETQTWELVAVFDYTTCEVCERETSLIEEEITDEDRASL